MPTPRTTLRDQLNRIASRLEKAKDGDLDALDSLLQPLKAVAAEIAAPAAMRTMAQRLSSSVQGMIDGESSMDDGVTRLSQGVAKLIASFDAIGPSALLDEEREESNGPTTESVTAPAGSASAAANPPSSPTSIAQTPSATPTLAPAPATPNPTADSEDLELLARFVDRQKGELEGFEVALLEREKGVGAGDEFVRRYLHTLKGEFGVLDLPDWAEIIHSVESLLETNDIGTEGLLRVKDLLQERLGLLNTLQGKIVSPEDIAWILGGTRNGAKSQPDHGKPQASIASETESVEPVSQAETDPFSSFGLDSSFLVDFISEGGDHIRNIEKSLLCLEVNPTDDESLNMVFRSCHTLKGLAGFLELKEIQRLAHAAENLMDRARNHHIVLGPQHVDVLLETTDMFRGLVDGLEKMLSGETYQPPPGIQDLIEKLKNADNLAPMQAIEPESAKKPVGQILVEKGIVPQSAVEEALREQSQGDPRPLGEILMDKEGVDARAVGSALGQQTLAKQPTQPLQPQAQQQGQGQQPSMGVEESIRVPVQRLDMLIDTIGEAVIAQSMVWADSAIKGAGDLSTEKKIAQASLILRQIQELSMSLRMVSIRSTFQKMSRLV
ncbi:MAG: Hpt domain-containing protein, partial [Fibrobacterota bacterium]